MPCRQFYLKMQLLSWLPKLFCAQECATRVRTHPAAYFAPVPNMQGRTSFFTKQGRATHTHLISPRIQNPRLKSQIASRQMRQVRVLAIFTARSMSTVRPGRGGIWDQLSARRSNRHTSMSLITRTLIHHPCPYNCCHSFLPSMKCDWWFDCFCTLQTNRQRFVTICRQLLPILAKNWASNLWPRSRMSLTKTGSVFHQRPNFFA